jgi:hypothetical protein
MVLTRNHIQDMDIMDDEKFALVDPQKTYTLPTSYEIPSDDVLDFFSWLGQELSGLSILDHFD